MKAPLVSVGIPVRNGARTIARAIDSVLAQSIGDVEIIVSDNDSTDDTALLVERYAARDPRVRLIRQAENLGATGNFMAVLAAARGEFFMFLGHDDWLEPEYLARCRESLGESPRVSLAAGLAYYHRGDVVRREHRLITLDAGGRSRRVLKYLFLVHDNGVFYGLARRADLQSLALEPVMGADWLWVARLAFLGRVVTRDDVAIHRDLGGSTRSYESIARALKLPAWQARYPNATIALAVLSDIAWKSPVYDAYPRPGRLALAAAAAGALAAATVRNRAGRVVADLSGRK